MAILRVATRTGELYVINEEERTWFRVNSTQRLDEKDSPLEGTTSELLTLQKGQSMTLLDQKGRPFSTSMVTTIAGPGYMERDYSI